MGVNLFNKVWGDNDDVEGGGGNDVSVDTVVLGASTAISCSNSECKCSCKDRPGGVARGWFFRFVSDDVVVANVGPAGDNGDNDAVGEGDVIISSV